jgi:FkbM family methyltransferase
MTLLSNLINVSRLLSQVISPQTYSNISNRQQYFKDYLGLVKNDYTLKFKNNLQIALKVNANTKWQIFEIVLKDCYHLRDLTDDPPKIIIDLGANIGVTSVYARSLFPRSKIFSFEPDMTCFPYLKKNIELNKFQKSIISYPLACYSQKAVRRLINIKPDLSDLTCPWWIYNYKKATTLQEIFKKNSIQTCDLLKIDVEAAEYDILYSLPNSLLERIQRIYVEYHNLDPNSNLNGSSLKKYLEKKNFKVKQRKSPFSNIGMLYAINNLSLQARWFPISHRQKNK